MSICQFDTPSTNRIIIVTTCVESTLWISILEIIVLPVSNAQRSALQIIASLECLSD